MNRRQTGSDDAKIFARTAQRSKAVNIYRTKSRGGIRF